MATMDFQGRFTNGQTAESRNVFVRIDNEGIRIFERAGDQNTAGEIGFAYWSYRKLRTIGPVKVGAPVHFAFIGPDMQRLTVDDPEFANHLREIAPIFLKRRTRAERPKEAKSVRGAAKWIVAGGGALAALTALWIYLPETAARVIPRSWESALGEQTIVEAAQFFGADTVRWCDTPRGSETIQNLTKKLADAARSDVDFKVHVLDSSTVNAFAVPGDQIVLIRGLIDSAKNPNEVAGVLAHEMAHVIRRHPTQNMVRALGLQVVAGTILGGDTSGDLLVATGGVLVLLKYGRDAEQEADDIARDMLIKAGFGIDGLNNFFRRLEAKTAASSDSGAFLSTHPPLHDRIANSSRKTAASRPAMSASQWRAVQTMCDK